MKFKNTMNIKDTFLKLTEYTIPFGEEHTLEKYLPNGFIKDSVGNYYIQIGDSDTLFTTHLDTFSSKYEKVNHIIDENIIKTDGSTILGGDNKVGTTILLYLIHNKKPGTYYFFIGEEPIVSGGLYGSTKIYNENPNFFKKFKRAIAFDRREKGSIITRQMGRKCCSDEFANDLISKFSLPHFIDTTGYYTDTAVFMNTIPECTNISCGVYNEHYNDEYVDIEYVEKLVNDVLKIDWDSITTNRNIKQLNNDIITNREYDKINDIFDKYSLINTNKYEYFNGVEDFVEYNGWFEDFNIKIYISGNTFRMVFREYNMTFEDCVELDRTLSYMFGVQVDYDHLEDKDIILYNDGIDINSLYMDWEEYLRYFNTINNDNTSFAIQGESIQWVDTTGIILNKKQVNVFIDDILNKNK